MIDNSKVSNIPCRLHNVGEGGVAGADEVIDDNKGKSQQQINEEVDQILGAGGSVDERIVAAVNVEKTRAEEAESDLDGRVDTLEEAVGTGGSVDSRIASAVAPKANSADVYAKTETYTKEEVHNLITTPSQKYVSVTATDQTTSVTDVLPATGATDTTYRVGNWDGTQYNDSVFSEYAWNGSAYIKLSTKSQIGEVYDISANHADTKYADLAAALGTNGANIPQSLRKGGMSVKYVQSSDNNYVQFHYMGTATTGSPNPFLNIYNWSFCGDNVIEENPELIEAKIDNDRNLLEARKADGTKVVYSDLEIKGRIINKELQEEFDNKVDKEEGKSLIDEDFASSQYTEKNEEWARYETDCEGKLLGGRKTDGTIVENMPTENPVSINNYADNSEFIEANTDAKGNLISGTKRDGSRFVSNLSCNFASINTLKADLVNLTKRGKKKLQESLGIDCIKTNLKQQSFSLLFKAAEGEVESFLFFSDPHYFSSYDKCELKDGATEYLKVIKDTFDNTPTDFVLCGGDWLTAHKQSIAVKDLGWVDGFMNNLFPNRYYPVNGNHDNNYQGELDGTTSTSANDGALSNQQMINLWFRKYGKMYYSFKGSSTKIYVFDTGIDWVTSMDSYKWEQVSWFANELLNNNDSHIVIALHIVQTSGYNFGDNITPISDNILKIAEAFNGRSTITLNGNTYNFSASHGTVHAAICGHTHYDAMTVINSIPVYCIKDAQTGDFDLLLFDYAASKLKSIRFGTGSDREMNLFNNI